MFISFFESTKYLGHLWPVALLRIYVGSVFLNAGIDKIHNHFLDQPVLQEILQKWIALGGQPVEYTNFINQWVIPHWQIFSYLVVVGEIAIGVSFILGFMVRPAALLAIFLSINFLIAAGESAATVNKLLIAINLTLLLLGAGRCFGFDYYFYKRVRGVWW